MFTVIVMVFEALFAGATKPLSVTVTSYIVVIVGVMFKVFAVPKLVAFP